MAHEWQICGTFGFRFLCDTAGVVVEVEETNRTSPPGAVTPTRPTPPAAMNAPRLKVNGVIV